MDKETIWRAHTSETYREYIERLPEFTSVLVIEAFYFGWMMRNGQAEREAEKDGGS